MLFRLSMLIALALFACGGGSQPRPDNPDAAVDAPGDLPDAPPAGPNALGQLCPAMQGGMGQPCPAGNNCVILQGLGSMTTGYCTPNCMNMTSICTTGYTGPAGGMPQCALSMMMGQPPNGCAIVCQQTTQCPTGLSCTPVPGQNVSVCVAP
jgi:hypothetical protein